MDKTQKLTLPPKAGDKWGSSQLDGSDSSNSSVEDLDAKGSMGSKKVLTPTKAVPNPSQWMADDIDFVCQYWYKTDVECFQKYWMNHIDKKDLAMTNMKDHSAYIEVARAMPGTVIEKSVFSVGTYREMLRKKDRDVAKFDKAIGAKFPLSTKGSRVPDDKKVSIDQVMLVYQCPNGMDMKYTDSDSFWHPGMMELWDLHSNNALNWVKLVMLSGTVDANYCPLCVLGDKQ